MGVEYRYKSWGLFFLFLFNLVIGLLLSFLFLVCFSFTDAEENWYIGAACLVIGLTALTCFWHCFKYLKLIINPVILILNEGHVKLQGLGNIKYEDIGIFSFLFLDMKYYFHGLPVYIRRCDLTVGVNGGKKKKFQILSDKHMNLKKREILTAMADKFPGIKKKSTPGQSGRTITCLDFEEYKKSVTPCANRE